MVYLMKTPFAPTVVVLFPDFRTTVYYIPHLRKCRKPGKDRRRLIEDVFDIGTRTPLVGCLRHPAT
jgi:hypothetical protein